MATVVIILVVAALCVGALVVAACMKCFDQLRVPMLAQVAILISVSVALFYISILAIEYKDADGSQVAVGYGIMLVVGGLMFLGTALFRLRVWFQRRPGGFRGSG